MELIENKTIFLFFLSILQQNWNQFNVIMIIPRLKKPVLLFGFLSFFRSLLLSFVKIID